MKLRRTLILAILLFAANARSLQAGEAALQGLEDYVNKAIAQWEVPGLGLAVVKNDVVVFAKGFGVRKLGDSTPVDDRTLFAIGSASKAFTAMSLAMLVDEGKIKWDDLATKHLPGFQLFDAYVTRELTVRDLLTHRSGLERGDALWHGSSLSREEILLRVRHLKPTWSVRSRFGYQNIMYLAAGQIVPSVTKKSWDDFVRERLFSPLGMNTSNTTVTALTSLDNVATPHAKIEDKVQVIPWRNIDNIAPAGSINSNAFEMAQWVRLHLNEGKIGDTRLVSSGAIKEMHASQTIVPPEPVWNMRYPEAHFTTYGMGWFLHDYKGRKVVEHGGNIDGMSALVAMIPEEKLGVVILTNLNGNSLPHAIMYRVFDAYLGAPPRDWSAEMHKKVQAQLALAKSSEKVREGQRAKDTAPSLPLEKYAGTFKEDLYGEVKVTHENGKLVLQYGPSLVGDLTHWHYDTFEAKFRSGLAAKAPVTFVLNGQGRADELRVSFLGNVTFRRVAGSTESKAITLTEEELRKFAGRFVARNSPLEISVELIGGKLKAVITGQPTVTLKPVNPNRFKAEGAPGDWTLQFELADGRVKQMTFEQTSAPHITLVPKP